MSFIDKRMIKLCFSLSLPRIIFLQKEPSPLNIKNPGKGGVGSLLDPSASSQPALPTLAPVGAPCCSCSMGSSQLELDKREIFQQASITSLSNQEVSLQRGRIFLLESENTFIMLKSIAWKALVGLDMGWRSIWYHYSTTGTWILVLITKDSCFQRLSNIFSVCPEIPLL